VPRGDRPFRPFETRLLAAFPWLFRAYRGLLWLRHEVLFYPVMRRNRLLSWLMTKLAKAWLAKEIPDHALRQTLTPDYPIGGKRVLISDDYYSALRRENVALVTDAIERFTPEGVVTKTGALHPADVAVFATGFRTNPFLSPMRFEGRGGRTLEEEWTGGARAYEGMTVAGFPNLFLLYGPNTNLGHNSILFMLECQYRYVLDALRRLDEEGADAIEVRREVMDAYDAELQRALAESSWSTVAESWYKDAAGRLTNNWPWTTAYYAWRTRRVDPEDYRFAIASGAAGRGDRAAA
jgi:cation diffusion facilitator CzcD-associated flavoprotein CzcO